MKSVKAFVDDMHSSHPVLLGLGKSIIFFTFLIFMGILAIAIPKSIFNSYSTSLKSVAQGVYKNGYLDTKYENNKLIDFEQDGKKIIISHDFFSKFIATPKDNRLEYTHQCSDKCLACLIAIPVLFLSIWLITLVSVDYYLFPYDDCD